jgi:hypothetical protein
MLRKTISGFFILAVSVCTSTSLAHAQTTQAFQSSSSELCGVGDNDTYNTVITLSQLFPKTLALVADKVNENQGDCFIYRFPSGTFITILETSAVRFSNLAEKKYYNSVNPRSPVKKPQRKIKTN